jgi:tRNA-2-methylthio-N6-dimethylallyladenosine synthase
MNEYDSDVVAQMLTGAGLVRVYDPKTADIILVNTCVVRAKPEHKAYSSLGRMSVIKRKRPDVIMGVLGCMAQKSGGDLIKKFPLLDLVIGPREIGSIMDFIEGVLINRKKIVAISLDPMPSSYNKCSGYFNGRVTGYISIMQGCNNFCSYCIVPFVRGREVCRSPNDILSEAKQLVSEGIKEITLLGQNVNSYCWKDNKKKGFPSLLRKLAAIKGLLRLRFTTSHPKDLSNELIRCFAEIDNLCPHLHLPFQAGSNSVLENMRRGYTREWYLDLILKLREICPDITITSDVMVGFPGESAKDFDMTLDLVETARFDSLFSFKYSDRDGTLAKQMGNKIDEGEKARRLRILQDLQRNITIRKNRALEGKCLEVLVEGSSKKGKLSTGRTKGNKIVNFTINNNNNNSLGELINVLIKDSSANSLSGEAVDC